MDNRLHICTQLEHEQNKHVSYKHVAHKFITTGVGYLHCITPNELQTLLDADVGYYFALQQSDIELYQMQQHKHDTSLFSKYMALYQRYNADMKRNHDVYIDTVQSSNYNSLQFDAMQRQHLSNPDDVDAEKRYDDMLTKLWNEVNIRQHYAYEHYQQSRITVASNKKRVTDMAQNINDELLELLNIDDDYYNERVKRTSVTNVEHVMYQYRQSQLELSISYQWLDIVTRLSDYRRVILFHTHKYTHETLVAEGVRMRTMMQNYCELLFRKYCIYYLHKHV